MKHDGKGRRVLLIHGLTGEPDEMAPLAGVLKEQSFAVRAPLLSGHGGSREELSVVRAETWLQNVESELESLSDGGAEVDVVGLSFGGLLALHLAQDYPEIVRSLALLAPAWLLRARRHNIALMTLSYLPELVLDRAGYRKKWLVDEEALVFEHRALPVYPIGALARLMQVRRKVAGKIRNVRCPTLILQDPFDALISPFGPGNLLQRVSSERREIKWHPWATHVLPLGKAYRAVADDIASFLL